MTKDQICFLNLDKLTSDVSDDRITRNWNTGNTGPSVTHAKASPLHHQWSEQIAKLCPTDKNDGPGSDPCIPQVSHFAEEKSSDDR